MGLGWGDRPSATATSGADRPRGIPVGAERETNSEPARPDLEPSGHIRAPKTAELIADRIRRLIVTGVLKEGDRLPAESELMAEFGVSRPTLREAFRILEAEHLVRIRRGSRGGAEILWPDIRVAARYVAVLLQFLGATIADVYEARTVLEPVCARMLAKRRTRQDLEDLRRCAEELRELVELGPGRSDVTRWASLTSRFHALIMERCGNHTLAVWGGVLQEIVRNHYIRSVQARMDDPQMTPSFRRTVRSYQKLIQLVEDQDAAAAEEHWRRHMENAAKLLLGTLNEQPLVDLFAD